MTDQNQSAEVTPSSSSPKQSIFSILGKLEDFLYDLLVNKAPALPKEWKDGFVKATPWVMIVVLIVSIPLLLFVLGLSGATAGLSYAVGYKAGAFQIIMAVLFLIPSMVLDGLAIPGLLKHSKSKGWNYLFYGMLLGMVYNIVDVNVLNLLFHVFYVYVIFQIRDYYKD